MTAARGGTRCPGAALCACVGVTPASFASAASIAGQRLLLAQDLQGLEERQADRAAGDGDADRGLGLAELEAVGLAGGQDGLLQGLGGGPVGRLQLLAGRA